MPRFRDGVNSVPPSAVNVVEVVPVVPKMLSGRSIEVFPWPVQWSYTTSLIFALGLTRVHGEAMLTVFTETYNSATFQVQQR